MAPLASLAFELIALNPQDTKATIVAHARARPYFGMSRWDQNTLRKDIKLY